MTALPAYHVPYNKIRPDTDLDDQGMGIVNVHRVTYQIDSGPETGHSRTITVPDLAFTPDGVKAAIEADLANFLAVARLKG